MAAYWINVLSFFSYVWWYCIKPAPLWRDVTPAADHQRHRLHCPRQTQQFLKIGDAFLHGINSQPHCVQPCAVPESKTFAELFVHHWSVYAFPVLRNFVLLTGGRKYLTRIFLTLNWRPSRSLMNTFALDAANHVYDADTCEDWMNIQNGDVQTTIKSKNIHSFSWCVTLTFSMQYTAY